jgi:uncharacterized protein DUF397
VIWRSTVKVDLSALAWRKSSFSGGEGTNCVEVALPGGGAAIRDSKNSDAAIVVSRAAWTNLLRVTRLT